MLGMSPFPHRIRPSKPPGCSWFGFGLVQRTTEDENPTRFSIIQSSNDDAFVDLEPGHQEHTLCSSFTDSIQILSEERNQKAESSISQSNNPNWHWHHLPNELIGDGGTMIARKEVKKNDIEIGEIKRAMNIVNKQITGRLLKKQHEGQAWIGRHSRYVGAA